MIYPSQVDEATSEIINDWFYYRHVTDNDKFPRYFKRVLDRDYTRYKEYMRIEAGKTGDTGRTTEFDWLVTNYFEGYTDHASNHSDRNISSNVNESNNSHGSSVINGGDDVTINNGSDNFTHGQNVSSSGSATNSNNSSHKGDTASEAESRTGALERIQPASASYTQENMNANDNRRGYITDTTRGFNAGEKQYDEDVDTNSSYNVGLHRNFPELNIKNPTSSSDIHVGTGTIGKDKSQDESNGYNSNSNSTQYSGTDSRVSGNTSRTTHGATVNTSGSDTGRSVANGSVTNTGDSQDITKQRNTGRGGEVADILSRARRYIVETSAIEWLIGQLECCFMDLDYGKE